MLRREAHGRLYCIRYQINLYTQTYSVEASQSHSTNEVQKSKPFPRN